MPVLPLRAQAHVCRTTHRTLFLATAQKQKLAQELEEIVEATGKQEFGTRKTHDLFRAFAPLRVVVVLRAVLASLFRPSAGHGNSMRNPSWPSAIPSGNSAFVASWASSCVMCVK